MQTGRFYNDGSPIQVGDTIADHNNLQAKVFEHKYRLRVALREHDIQFGISCSLGLFIIDGVTKVDQ